MGNLYSHGSKYKVYHKVLLTVQLIREKMDTYFIYLDEFRDKHASMGKDKNKDHRHTVPSKVSQNSFVVYMYVKRTTGLLFQ